MYSLLAKRAFSFFPSSHLHHYHHYLSLFPPLLRLSLSTQAQQQKEELPFIARHLVSSFGFSLDRALKVSTSKKLAAIKSPDRPNSIVSFLNEIGLSDSQIRGIISFKPSILEFSVDETLKHQASALVDAGFTGEILVQLVRSNPLCLCSKDTLPRLQFWRKFVGNSNELLSKVLQRNSLLISIDVDKRVVPKLNLLKEFGFSNRDIVTLLVFGARFYMLRSLETSRQVLKRTEELGFTRGSIMFIHGLRVISSCSKETVERKVEFYKRMYGWSEEEFFSAVKKFPTVLKLSEDSVRLKMEFLIQNAEIEPRRIASRPILLSFSLRRLKERVNILSALEAKGLEKKCNLLNAFVLSEKQFVKRYVVPYQKNVPEISEVHIAACGEKVTPVQSEKTSQSLECKCAA